MGGDTIRMSLRAAATLYARGLAAIRQERLRAVSLEPPGTLVCRFVDRRSSVPLSGVRVACVFGREIVQLEADANGSCRATVPQGVYDLLISVRGDLALTLRGIGVLASHTQSLTRAIAPDDATGDVQPLSALGGYLVDRLAHPLVEAAITATSRTNGPTYTARSDRAGAYIIHGLQPGEYDVVTRSTTRTLAHERLTIPSKPVFRRLDQRLLVVT